MFSILGVNLMTGKMGRCIDNTQSPPIDPVFGMDKNTVK